MHDVALSLSVRCRQVLDDPVAAELVRLVVVVGDLAVPAAFFGEEV